MNAKTITRILAVAVIAAGSYYAYKRFYWNKRKAIKYIIKNDPDKNAKESDLETFGEGYLVARAKAMMNGDDTFVYEGITLQTDTGMTKK